MSNTFGTAKVFALVLLLFFANQISLKAQTRVEADSIYRIPAGTRIRLRMEGEIGSKFSSVNDTFLARVAVPVVIRDVTVLPTGTLVEGRVTDSSPASIGNQNGRIDVRMETLRFSDRTERSIDGVPVSPFRVKRSGNWLPVVGGSIIGAAVGFAVGSAPGAVIGAGIGGGIGAGARYSRRGSDIRLKEDDVFEIVLKKEVVLPVLDY
jgi:hypothetical protein